jgi:hypothetical protein
MMETVQGFTAENKNLKIYNTKAVIDLVFSSFDFTGDSGSYFLRVLDERLGTEIKEYISQLTRNDNSLVFNASVSDMTFHDNGRYYYELGYIRSGGYEELLRYGEFIVV